MAPRRFRLLSLLPALLIAMMGCGKDGDKARSDGSGLGRLRVLGGTVEHRRGEAHQTLTTGAELSVEAGDTIKTGPGAEAVLVGRDQCHHMKAGSELIVRGPDPDGRDLGVVEIVTGIVTFMFPPGEKKKFRFQAVTHHAVAAVEGTIFRIEATASGDRIRVVRGTVAVRARTPETTEPGPAQSLTAGREARFGPEGPSLADVPPEELEAIKKEIFAARANLGGAILNF